MGLEFRGFRFWGLGFRVLGFRVLGFRVLGFRVCRNLRSKKALCWNGSKTTWHAPKIPYALQRSPKTIARPC